MPGKIKITKDENGQVNAPCPHAQDHIVGSFGCQWCIYCQAIARDKGVVYCDYDLEEDV